MGYGIARRARSRKRGLFRKPPAAREVGDRLGWLVRRMEKAAVVRAGWKKDRYVAELDMHPAADSVTLVVEPDGELAVTGETWRIGPGYHVDVLTRIARILDELEYAWSDDVDPETISAEMAAWLAGELRAGNTSLGVPRAFKLPEAAVLTPLGPRDAAWRDAVLADPLRAADAFAWWRTATPAAYSRALLALWHDVPWREPLDNAERAVMKQADADLRAARLADPKLDLPWPEWAELLGYLGNVSERADDIRTRAAGRTPTIGYRRHALEVELSGGWVIELSGGFVGAWEDDDARYWATDGNRAIEFTSLTANDGLDSQRLLEVAPERHPVVDRIADAARLGRAEAYDEDDVHVVHGLMASAPHVAFLTCKGARADEPWALATWRTLRRAD